jgi:Holliday junction resolvase RusA-like endonuclease
MITFTIPGTPWAKQRPRFSRKSGRAYTPAETVSFEATVGQIALPHFPAPIDGPVRLTVWATFVPPQSWSKKKTEATLHRPHVGRKDIDNILKSVMDGLNRIAWEDDGQVFEISARKVWGIHPQTVVTVESVQ